MARILPVSIYLPDDQKVKAEAIRRKLSQISGVNLSRSAVINRAIDDLFLSICLPEKTIGSQEGKDQKAA